jgi:hypothetical protein
MNMMMMMMMMMMTIDVTHLGLYVSNKEGSSTQSVGE